MIWLVQSICFLLGIGGLVASVPSELLTLSMLVASVFGVYVSYTKPNIDDVGLWTSIVGIFLSLVGIAVLFTIGMPAYIPAVALIALVTFNAIRKIRAKSKVVKGVAS